MGTKLDDGGTAFPQTFNESWGGETSCSVTGGMSLRDWFAGQALAGLIVGCSGILGREKDGSPHFSAYASGPCNSVLASRAYAVAGAMIAARKAVE